MARRRRTCSSFPMARLENSTRCRSCSSISDCVHWLSKFRNDVTAGLSSDNETHRNQSKRFESSRICTQSCFNIVETITSCRLHVYGRSYMLHNIITTDKDDTVHSNSVCFFVLSFPLSSALSASNRCSSRRMSSSN